MKKVNCVFVVDRVTGMATRQVNEENKWVLDGQGIATIKHDGEACMVRNGALYRRWNRTLQKQFVKLWKRDPKSFVWDEYMFKPIPEGAIACENNPAKITLHWPYWIPVLSGNENVFFNEAFCKKSTWEDGTYELVGPKVLHNMYNLSSHELRRHGDCVVDIKDYSFDGLRCFMEDLDSEGVVWHHPDGRMAKLRRDHFNLKWGEDDPRNDKEARANFVP